jgi:hypothetical protein
LILSENDDYLSGSVSFFGSLFREWAVLLRLVSLYGKDLKTRAFGTSASGTGSI